MEKLPSIALNKNMIVLSTEKVEEAEALMVKESGTKTVGTHSGAFHCDEILACTMLKYTSTYKNFKIIRSRTEEIHNKVDILVDVGSTFDVEKNRFDHH
jgi:hypothetical protein